VILYPAIDLKDGQCVRLLRGDMAAATVFGDDPAAQARSFRDAGCAWLHLVDLNGAFAGRPVNGAAVEAILAAVDIPVQLGGGIRDMATVETWLIRPCPVRRKAKKASGRIQTVGAAAVSRQAAISPPLTSSV